MIPILPSPIKRNCRVCNKPKMRHEIYRGNEAQGYLCYNCLFRHYENIRQLAEARPRACNVCGVTFAQLRERGAVDVMRTVDKDGLLLLCCLPCAAKYEAKVPGYRNTLMGQKPDLRERIDHAVKVYIERERRRKLAAEESRLIREYLTLREGERVKR